MQWTSVYISVPRSPRQSALTDRPRKVRKSRAEERVGLEHVTCVTSHTLTRRPSGILSGFCSLLEETYSA